VSVGGSRDASGKPQALQVRRPGERLFHNGEGTSKGLLGSRSRARLFVVEHPGGRERLQGASPNAVRKPRGGWPRLGAARRMAEGPREGEAQEGIGLRGSANSRTRGTGLRGREALRTGLRIALPNGRGSDRREVRSRRAVNVVEATGLERGTDGPGGTNP
jgi:hypothetical protein